MAHEANTASRNRKLVLYVYVAAVDLLAVVLLTSLPIEGLQAHAGMVLLLAVLAALVGSRPVRVPALRTEVAASDAFALCALAVLGPVQAVLVALSGVIGAVLGEKRRPAAIRVAFNLGGVGLSVASAAWWFTLAGGHAGGDLGALALPLGGATAVYFLLNTMLVSTAIAVERGHPFQATWSGSFLWTAVAASTGLTLAVVLVFLLETVGPWALLLGVPPAWLLATFYRTNKERIEEQDGRIETVVGINAELERKVAERTRELQELLARIEATNQQLRETNERLLEAGRIKNEFLANVSHELRTPLNAIIGFSDLLSDSTFGPLSDDQRDYLRDIHDSGEHLLGLINNILDLSKIEAGRMELQARPVDVSTVVREAASMLRTQATKKGVSLTVECGPDVEAGELDPGMFREILANLLSNAVKFTPSGGKVEASITRRERDLVVAVRDTGVGIPSEHLDRVFDEFYQVDGSYSRAYEGTGLGLALVRRMMSLHGGTVSVESEAGEGAVFTCVFPACLGGAVEPDAQGQDAWSASAPVHRTVLVVEDNPLNLKLTRNALRSRGYGVLEASTGEQALEVLRDQQADLVLMDIQLPGMDGLEVTRRLKADPSTSNIQIVAVTAHAREEDAIRARAAGCVGYITKPIRVAQFPSQIETFLAAREGAA